LIPADVATVAMCYGLAGKIATQNYHLRYETIVDAIVEHLLQPKKSMWMV
jgi:hypothetical protein